MNIDFKKVSDIDDFQSKALNIELQNLIDDFGIEVVVDKFDFLFKINKLNIKLILYHSEMSDYLEDKDMFKWINHYLIEIRDKLNSGKSIIEETNHSSISIDTTWSDVESYEFLRWDVINEVFDTDKVQHDC